MDAVTLEHVAVSRTYPWLSDPARVEENVARLQRSTAAIVSAGLRPFFIFGCPAYIETGQLAVEASGAVASLIGAPVSRIDPRQSVLCIQSVAVRQLYRELLAQHFAHFPETAGILFYTMDELAEVCDEFDPCPRCHGVPLHERLPDYLRYLRSVIDDLKPDVEMWWEPWEFTAAQTYAVVERLDPRIKLSVHTSIHEVYFTNRPDTWLRHLCRLAADHGISVVAELFFSGTGEDLGPLPAFPCPRLVHEQLRSVAELPAITGIKEYFGTVVEHISVNERTLAEYLRRPDASYAEISTRLAAGFGPGAGAALQRAWEEAARALEVYPWDLSWRMRQYNSVRYDQTGADYWAQSFSSTLPTPWTTPSWESSRLSFYVVARNAAAPGPRLLEESFQHMLRCVQHLDRALEYTALAEGTLPSPSGSAVAHQAELQRQADSLRIFRHLTLSRLYHLQASRLAADLRAGSAAPAAALETCLRADLANARQLLGLVGERNYGGFDRTAFARTVDGMASGIQDFLRDPAAWSQDHFLET
jgi:hypothetical protein